MHKRLIQVMLLLSGMMIGAAAQADAGHAGHGDSKPAAGMPGMDHGKMDHSKMEEHWTAPPEMARRTNPVRADSASLARGRQVYDTNCASCHGAAGKGDGPAAQALKPKPADLAMMAPQHPPGDLAWKVENGRGAMPPWKGVLTENQIWDVVNYVRSFGGPAKPAPAHSGGHAH